MKFHVLPTPSKLTKEELQNKIVRLAFNDLKNEVSTTHQKLLKKEKGMHHASIFFLYDNESMKKLVNLIRPGDELVIHGEGQPFVIGLSESSQFDLTALRLAKILSKNNLPDIDINIQLLACFSATQYNNLNFAQDTSAALSHVFEYKNITVSGFTGLVVVSGGGKYSVSADIKNKKKGGHASLEDAKMTYQHGEVIVKGKVLTDNSNIAYGWADNYINNSLQGKRIIEFSEGKEPNAKPQKLARSHSLQSFFKPELQDDKPKAIEPIISTTLRLD